MESKSEIMITPAPLSEVGPAPLVVGGGSSEVVKTWGRVSAEGARDCSTGAETSSTDVEPGSRGGG